MKFILITIIFFNIFSKSIIFGQNIISENEIKKYLLNNINTLDPIEGIYILEYRSYELYQNDIKTDEMPYNEVFETWAILKDIETQKLKLWNKHVDDDFYKQNIYVLPKSTRGSYFYIDRNSKKSSLSLDNNYKLKRLIFHGKEYWDEQKKKNPNLKGENVSAITEEFFSKIYPTYREYENKSIISNNYTSNFLLNALNNSKNLIEFNNKINFEYEQDGSKKLSENGFHYTQKYKEKHDVTPMVTYSTNAELEQIILIGQLSACKAIHSKINNTFSTLKFEFKDKDNLGMIIIY